MTTSWAGRYGSRRLAWLAFAVAACVVRPAPVSASNPFAEGFPLVFDAEWVRLDVDGDTLEVSGTFLFLCREPIEQPLALFFPFPVDSLLGGAHMVSLEFRVGDRAAVPGRWEDVPGNPGVRWWMPPCPGDSFVAEWVYRQAIRADYARYIVLSARLWGRPLRYAAFEIGLPPGAEPLEFSYPFERGGTGEEACYAWETEEFFPDRDIVVRWRAGAPAR